MLTIAGGVIIGLFGFVAVCFVLGLLFDWREDRRYMRQWERPEDRVVRIFVWTTLGIFSAATIMWLHLWGVV